MKLSNGILNVTIAEHGAELRSVIKNGTEYMWQADPKYWGKTSPILFPFVGASLDDKYSVNGKTYKMQQHGFARDNDFELIEQNETSAVFQLRETDETLAIYPYKFKLLVGYKLSGNTITVSWSVVNENDSDMPFSIGAHPAFNLRPDTSFKFNTDKDIKYFSIQDDGSCDIANEKTLKNDGYVPIYNGMFDTGAYVIEDNQASVVSLCDSDKKEYVSVRFTAPLFGLWHPKGNNIPFVCIEPWYGRAYKPGFDGDLFDRDYIQKLAPHSTFNAEYTIEYI